MTDKTQKPVFEPSWVFENTEVSKTGKVASKKLPSGKLDSLVEITPTLQSNGVWKKWVREQDLYEVQHGELNE